MFRAASHSGAVSFSNRGADARICCQYLNAPGLSPFRRSHDSLSSWTAGTCLALRRWNLRRTTSGVYNLMRYELRATAKSLLFYLLAVSTPILITYLCLIFVLGPNERRVATDDSREPTRIAIVVSNAREIRAALERPLPALEPLGPIAQKSARALGGPKFAVKAQPRRPVLSAEAKEAFASSELPAQLTPVNKYDRHVSNY